jgi:hypothetical protein
MLKVCRVDQQYILLREDAPIPMLNERPYYQTPAGALSALADEIADHIQDGASHKSVLVEPNEYASRALIEKYGFTAVDTL